MKNLFFCTLALITVFTDPAFIKMDPREYLFQFGYLEEKYPTPEELHNGILIFQRFNGLPQTGKIDEKTLQLMNKPRCGEKDMNSQNRRLYERPVTEAPLDERPQTEQPPAGYNLVSTWSRHTITWRITKYSKTSPLSIAEQRREIINGIHQWSRVAPLVFQEIEDFADINISFVKDAYHGHPSIFSPNALAHAFYPPAQGGVHFWDLRNWIIGNDDGFDLQTVTAHEIGHAIGLNHSNHQSALMSGPYSEITDDFKLHQDDIAAVQALYGKRNSKVDSGITKQNPHWRFSTPNIHPIGNGFCNHFYSRITATMRISGNDFVFVDNWAVIDGRNGRKMHIRTLFPNGPYSVQAAVFSNAANKAYLFEGERVWAYILGSNGQFLSVNYFPKYLASKYSHNPECAMRFEYSGSESIIIIKNGFWQYFIPLSEDVDPIGVFPTRLSYFNIPQRIDAAISSNDDIYFIVKDRAHRLRIGHAHVDTRGIPINLAFNRCKN